MSESASQALQDIKVLQIGESRAVRIAGMILKDCGAEVVRVCHRPNEDVAVTERSKDFIVDFESLNEQSSAQLLHRADIVVDHGDAAYFHDVIRKNSNSLEHLVHCSLPFSASCDDRLSAWDEKSVGVTAGLYETPTGLGRPHAHDLPVVSTAAAFHAVNSIAMALVGRERDGKGRDIEIPLEKVALSSQVLVAMISSRPPVRWQPLRWLASPFMGIWKTAGNDYVYIHIGMPRHLRTFLFLIESEGFGKEKQKIRKLLHKKTRRDPSLSAGVWEAMNVSRVMKSLFEKRSADFWEKCLGDAGLCCGKVRSFEEWKKHPQVVKSVEIVSLQLDNKRLVVPGKVMNEEASRTEVASTGGEGVFISQLLEKWPRKSAAEKNHSILPLKGVKVLDLSRVIAGPFAGRLLAEYGADVMHLSVRGNHLSWEEPFHVAFNAGKKSSVVDCSRPGGRERLREVICEYKPDIVIHNFLNKPAEKLGIDHQSLKKINPKIISIGIKAYNSCGPWSSRPGFEQNIQAASGIMRAYSGKSAPDILPVAYNDLGTGLVGSFAAALSYYRLLKGKGGGHISTSLTVPAMYLQMDKLNGNTENNHLLDGFYRSKDSWFYFSLKPGKEQNLLGIPEVQKSVSDLSRRNLANVFRKKSITFWKNRVEELSLDDSVLIIERKPMKAIIKAQVRKKAGVFTYKHHRKTGEILVCRSPVMMEPQGIREIPTAEPIGSSHVSEHTQTENPEGAVSETKYQRFRWFLDQCRWVIVIVWQKITL
ncbi:MAG: CoA transferase [Chitinispirillaceae bacterium]